MKNFTCPLCALEFEGAFCHGSCPMAKGCAMVRCPRCNYEFVQDGSLAAFVRRMFTRRETHGSPGN